MLPQLHPALLGVVASGLLFTATFPQVLGPLRGGGGAAAAPDCGSRCRRGAAAVRHPFSASVEPPAPLPPPPPPPPTDRPHFAVVMAFYARNASDAFRLPCMASLSSLARQTYSAWTLVAAGDGLTPQQEARLRAAIAAAGVPPGRVVLERSPEAMRERHLYPGDAKTIWMFAGVNALNTALKRAYALPGVTHVARLDDDDVWYPMHLKHLADGYAFKPNVSFVYTAAKGFGANLYPHPLLFGRIEGAASDEPPHPCGLIHSAASWSAGLRLFYRQVAEQAAAKRDTSLSCCMGSPQTCKDGDILPADSDLWERVRVLVNKQRLKSVLFAATDVHYSDRAASKCLADAVAAGAVPSGACHNALTHVPGFPNSTCLQL